MTGNVSQWGMTENVLKVQTANLTNIATWENAQTSRRQENDASTEMSAADKQPASSTMRDPSLEYALNT